MATHQRFHFSLLFYGVFLFAPVATGQVVYVDADATGTTPDGFTWCTAFLDLQDALVPATAGQTIRVANGTYKPDQGVAQTSGDRSATFQLVTGVTIEGGYAGCGAPDPDERDFVADETTLSGDLDGDDVSNVIDGLRCRASFEPSCAVFDTNPIDSIVEALELGLSDNAYHVVNGSNTDATAVLDGFTITGGNADGSSPEDSGGGFFNRRSAGPLGIGPTVSNCLLTANFASFGGAIYTDNGSTISVSNSTFVGNVGSSQGGAVYTSVGSTGTTPTLTNCGFFGNESLTGGGMYANERLALTNSVFSGNRSIFAAGASGNGDGGGLYVRSPRSAKVINCTFSGNVAERGGGIATVFGSVCSFALTNSILWGNMLDGTPGGTGPQLANACLSNVTYTDIQGGLTGTGNLNEDPLFVEPDGADNVLGTADDNLRLDCGSTVVDAGLNSAVPASVVVDLDGNPRTVNLIVDMGAYESASGTGLPVITCPDDFVAECPADTDPGVTGSATAIDDCTLVSIPTTYSDSSLPGCGNTVTITRTWSASNESGVTTCVPDQIITINDTTDPNLTIPLDIEIDCIESTQPLDTGQATAADSCGDVAVTYNDNVTAGDCADESVIARTWTATDACGNVSSGVQVITVVDDTAPVLTVPADVTIECTDDSSPTGTGTATATDNCNGAPVISSSDSTAAGSCANESVITRTWTATDDCGNSVSADQTITIVDTTAPILSVPADAIVECNDDTTSSNTGTATATDSCDTAPTITQSDNIVPGLCPNESVITRTWTATDDCGNSDSLVQTIAVVDTNGPVISCPASLALDCGDSTDPVDTGSATTFDNCNTDPALTSFDAFAADSCPQEGVITRTWTATDDCGNDSSCDQEISITDTTAPTLAIGTDPISIVDADCSGDEAVTLPAGSAVDDCDPAPSVTDDAPGTIPAGGTTTVTVTASDACGNTSAPSTIDVTVDYGATIKVKAKRYVIGFGPWPFITKQPLDNILVQVFDKSPGSCALAQTPYGYIFWHHFDDIVANCTPVNSGVTDSNGIVYIDVPPGDYVVISHFDSDDDGDLDQYIGGFAHNVECGEVHLERLFTIKLANGRRWPCRYHRLTGSELLIVEPEYVVWDEEQQLYPFVFESVGDWDVTTAVTPPEGFESDYDELSDEVEDDVSGVQFTITEVGSDLVPTETKFDVWHNGRRHVIESKVDIRLTPEYARSRGFEVAELRQRGLIVDDLDKVAEGPQLRK